MTAVQLRRQVKEYPVERVRLVVTDVVQDPELADLIATWLTTVWRKTKPIHLP